MSPARSADAGFSPLDERLGLLPGLHLTPILIEGLVRLASLAPFAQIPPLLAHFTGVTVAAETVRRLTEAAGAAQVTRETAAVERIERWLPTPPPGPAVQLLSVDGAFVPLVGGGWAEVKTLALGAVHAAAHDADQTHTTQLSYFSRLTDAASFARLATVETQRRGTETAGTVVAVVDGAEWCQGFIDHQRHDAVRVLDFAHAVEHLGQVAQVCFGPGTAAASEWLGQQAHALRHGDEAQVLTCLAALATSGPAEARELARATQAYLSTRREQIRYQTFAAAGYPIGSGCVESANKLVVEARLKGSGMHWSRAAVNPMLALRTLLANDRWELEWPVLWETWRQQVRERAATQRATRQHTRVVLEPVPPPAPVAPDPPPVPAPARRGTRTPAPNHPWRRWSLSRAKR
jgi:hypothetical protein